MSALLHQIVLTLLPSVGNITAKNLLSYCGGLEPIFSASKQQLARIPGIGEKTAAAISQQHTELFEKAEKEIKFIEKNNITPIFFTDKNYPYRLRECSDSPILLYHKGTANLDSPRILSIVGTRNATDYGKEICQKLIEDLTRYQPLIVSGLAYGIDICAHRACIAQGLPTTGVLAHGLTKIYPKLHTTTARLMLENGSLLTEFMSPTLPDAVNFPRRNRIVAGMSDATIVIETDVKGGSMITARCAGSYNREVYAFPGSLHSNYSRGCHHLIKNNEAALVESADDIAEWLGWASSAKDQQAPTEQPNLFSNLSQDEQLILGVLRQKGIQGLHIDQLAEHCQLTYGQMAMNLLELEMKGIIKAIPGSVYKVVR